MKMCFSVTIDIDINSANLKDIIEGFRKAIRPCFQESGNKDTGVFYSKVYGRWYTPEDAWKFEADMENL